MNLVKVRDIIIGSGMPKICVPITGSSSEEIMYEAMHAVKKEPDLIEWRADYYDDIFEDGKLIDMLKRLRMILGNIPLLYTFRTLGEGGEKGIEVKFYEKLAVKAADSGFIDLMDIEAFYDDGLTNRLVDKGKESDVKIILSNHRFDLTPDKQEIISLLCKMLSYAPDIIKLAVMPKSVKDVITLIMATEEMSRTYSDIPLITVSMSKEGCISRFTGELFGSAVTFASAMEASAPGQVDIDDTRIMLNIINRCLNEV